MSEPYKYPKADPLTDPKYVPCSLCWDMVWDQHTIFMSNEWIQKCADRNGTEVHLIGARTQACLDCIRTLSRMDHMSPDITGHVESAQKPDCPPGLKRMP